MEMHNCCRCGKEIDDDEWVVNWTSCNECFDAHYDAYLKEKHRQEVEMDIDNEPPENTFDVEAARLRQVERRRQEDLEIARSFQELGDHWRQRSEGMRDYVLGRIFELLLERK